MLEVLIFGLTIAHQANVIITKYATYFKVLKTEQHNHY